MANFTVATEMPSGARSRGYAFEVEENATKWFEAILKQMRIFNIVGSAVVMLGSETEVMRENIP